MSDRGLDRCDKEPSVPDKRAHRGPHPEDHLLFASTHWPALREAVADLSWLLSKGYADRSALKLVGDRFSFTERQRIAVMRCSCSDESLARRGAHEVNAESMAGRDLLIDGYNVLTTIEAALAGGVVIEGRDGCFRDMASMHGTFRKVQETDSALLILGEVLVELKTRRCVWLLDSPVSNSGRLKTGMQRLAGEKGWSWEVQLVPDPDPVLAASDGVVATADSVVLDQARQWFNLVRHAMGSRLPSAKVIDLSKPSS
jgi:hypothetical protein